MPLLEVDDVHTFYGTIEALKGVSLTVEEGEIVTLIGANGAGKSTVLRTICGLNAPREGTVTFDGEEISSRPPQAIVALGISHAPEDPVAWLDDHGWHATVHRRGDLAATYGRPEWSLLSSRSLVEAVRAPR